MERTRKKLNFFGVVVALVAIFACFMFVGCGKQVVKPENGITIHSPFKTVYYVGEELNIEGGVINYTYNGVVDQVELTEDMIYGFDNLEIGTRDLIVSYGDYSIFVEYTINELPAFFSSGIYVSTESITHGEYTYYLVINADALDEVIKGGLVESLEGIENFDWDNLSFERFNYSKSFRNGAWSATATKVDGEKLTSIRISQISENAFHFHGERSPQLQVLDLYMEKL